MMDIPLLLDKRLEPPLQLDERLKPGDTNIPEGDKLRQNGDHELSNGMKVKSDGTGLRLAINGVIDLAESKLSETYHEVYQEWQGHYANGELETIIHNISTERESRQEAYMFSNCYFLTPKWQIPHEAIGVGGALKPLWEEQRREAKFEERKALFLLAVFNSIVDSIGMCILRLSSC
jgi:hypothetical protein